jgi:hypothetical protein
MFRLLSFLILVVSALLLLCIQLIQAGAYDPTDVWAALPATTDCQPPCWQQIRPGETPAEAALSLLEQSAWVEVITVGDQFIHWTWSGQQPRLVNAAEPGRLRLEQGRVRSIHVPVHLSLGDLYFLWGHPVWNSTGRSGGKAEIRLAYPAEYLEVAIFVQCPATRADFWHAQLHLTLQSQRPRGIGFTANSFHQSIAC